MENVWNEFVSGACKTADTEIRFDGIEWSRHPVCEGVELKHILTAKDTSGRFSFHLVRIAPGKCIKTHIHEKQVETHEVICGSGVCMNNGAAILYAPGIISIFEAGIPHEVTAGADGLHLFAKFFPALC